MKIGFDRALLLTLGGTLIVALLAGGVTLDRRLVAELEQDARADLAMAPPVLVDRQATQGEMLRMHAMELAASPGLGSALRANDPSGAIADAESMAEAWPEGPVVIGPDGSVWLGPGVASQIDPARTMGDGPYRVAFDSTGLYALALAPVMNADNRVGVAGVALPLDSGMAETLAGLTRSEVALVGADGSLVATTLDPAVAGGLLARAADAPEGEVVEIDLPGAGRFWGTAADLGSAGRALFFHEAARELAALPRLRRAGLIAAGLALIVTLLVGLAMARTLSRPVRALAEASHGVARGDFDSPLPASRVAEVDTVGRAFAEMRTALAARLSELRDMNVELADRQERLQALQTELVQRDRLVAAGRLVTELAHEIRNPVANVRNSLEVVRRHVESDKAREFTDLAIGELLRMHELAERMLDLNRPVSEGEGTCDARAVAADVAALVGLADRDRRWQVSIDGPAELPVAIPPDSLKQVLLNLVTNAQEASPDGGPIEIRLAAAGDRARIEVADRGAGIGDDVLPHVFDPFFTTKEAVHGVGLGLFIAEGVIRSQGGSLTAARRDPGPGSVFRIDLPGVAAGARAADVAARAGAATPTPGTPARRPAATEPERP